MSSDVKHLQEAYRQQALVNKDLVLIPFYGTEEFEGFRKYCDKIGQTPTTVVAQFIRSHAALVKKLPALVKGQEYGFLTMYSGQETEGHSFPSFIATDLYSKVHDLRRMRCLDSDDVVKVFEGNTNKVLFEGPAAAEQVEYYCQHEYFAVLTKKRTSE